MRPFLDAMAGTLTERSAEELIVGVFIALLLSLAAAWGFAAIRGRVKDAVTVLTVAVLLANLSGMIVAASYIRMARGPSARPGGRPRIDPETAQNMAVEAAIRGIFDSADLDRDGRLTPAEAAAASSLFVEQVGAGQDPGPEALGSAIRDRVRNLLQARDRFRSAGGVRPAGEPATLFTDIAPPPR